MICSVVVIESTHIRIQQNTFWENGIEYASNNFMNIQ